MDKRTTDSKCRILTQTQRCRVVNSQNVDSGLVPFCNISTHIRQSDPALYLDLSCNSVHKSCLEHTLYCSHSHFSHLLEWSSQGENGSVELGKSMGFKVIVDEVQRLPDEDDAK